MGGGGERGHFGSGPCSKPLVASVFCTVFFNALMCGDTLLGCRIYSALNLVTAGDLFLVDSVGIQLRSI